MLLYQNPTDKKQRKTVTLKASISPETAKYRNKILWRSQNPAIATVNKRGKITAGKQTGITYVYAVSAEGGKQVRIKVTVKK